MIFSFTNTRFLLYNIEEKQFSQSIYIIIIAIIEYNLVIKNIVALFCSVTRNIINENFIQQSCILTHII